MTTRASNRYRVAILGGGIGGLSCAHELSRRGADVTIYEAGRFLGGKARSHYVPGTGTGGRRDLPGEHGFRFYPAFYQHVIATMNEIPDPLSPTGFVSGNLVGAPEAGMAQGGGPLIITPRRVLERSMYAAHLDDEVKVGSTGVTNTGRLLIHPPGSWRDRPTATTSIPNLFLAADYVRTAVDVASMEGANEAGRRAARGVLRRFGGDADSVELFEFEMLDRFEHLRRVDRGMHALGLPHLFDAPTKAMEQAREAVRLALAA